MAREKKKAEQPVDEVAAAAFSGLGDGNAPSPAPKGRGAGKDVADSPPPTPDIARPLAKPRPRKPPAAATEIVPLIATPAPAPSEGGGESANDFSLKAREAGAMLDAVLQQCREARTQLQREMEERKGVDREAETIREQSKLAHERLLRDGEEARAAHQQLLAQTREGAEQVKRELTTTAAQMAAAGREADKLFQMFAEGVTLLNRECATTASQLAEARQQFFQGFAQEVGLLHQNLREAGQSMQDLPRQAEAFRLRLAEAREEGRAFEEEAAAARRNLEAVEDETRQASQHLAALHAEVAEAEGWLAALRLGLEESRRRPEPAKPAHETIVEDTPPPMPEPEPEPRNHLGIAVDPGVVVAEVAPGTPAAAAGLIRGDVITAVNETPVLSGPELRELILAEEASGELVFSLKRGGFATEARVRFEVGGEESAEEKQLGATVEEGVVVAEVAPGTPGAFAGLIHGDIINAINGEAVYTGSQLRDVIHALEGRSEVTIRFTRSGEGHEVKTRLEEVTATPSA